MDSPLVSVLMTCYNREKYIAEAIESVLKSSFKDFELIICDDRSTDASVGIIKKYAAQDSRVKFYINETNLGDYPNRNKAAGYATGKYIKYVDSDDSIYPWGLDILVQQMEANPTAGYGLCSLLPDDDKPYPILLSPQQAYYYNYFKKGIFQKAPLSSIIRRDIFIKENGFVPHRMSSDYEMWHRLSLKYAVLLMGDGIVWSRIHAGQEMSDANDYIDAYENITVRYLSHAECPMPSDDVQRAYKKIRKHLKKSIVKNLLALRFAHVPNDLKRLTLYLKK